MSWEGFTIYTVSFCLAYLLGLLSSLGTLAGRARISKVVSKEDLGKLQIELKQ